MGSPLVNVWVELEGLCAQAPQTLSDIHPEKLSYSMGLPVITLSSSWEALGIIRYGTSQDRLGCAAVTSCKFSVI